MTIKRPNVTNSTNRTSYVTAGLVALALALALLGYIAGAQAGAGAGAGAQRVSVSVTSATPKQEQEQERKQETQAQAIEQEREQLERCKEAISDNADFPGFNDERCKGIQEDDIRLNGTYDLMWQKLLNCANDWIESDIQCNYGTEDQWLKAYAMNEKGELDI